MHVRLNGIMFVSELTHVATLATILFNVIKNSINIDIDNKLIRFKVHYPLNTQIHIYDSFILVCEKCHHISVVYIYYIRYSRTTPNILFEVNGVSFSVYE